MKPQYIICKHIYDEWKNISHSLEHSIGETYTAKALGITKVIYSSREEAEDDLKKLLDNHPGGHYSIVPLQE